MFALAAAIYHATSADEIATHVTKCKCILWPHKRILIMAVQRQMQREFGLNPPNKLSIYTWYMHFT